MARRDRGKERAAGAQYAPVGAQLKTLGCPQRSLIYIQRRFKSTRALARDFCNFLTFFPDLQQGKAAHLVLHSMVFKKPHNFVHDPVRQWPPV